MAGTFKARSQHPVGSLRTLSGLIMMVNFVSIVDSLSSINLSIYIIRHNSFIH